MRRRSAYENDAEEEVSQCPMSYQYIAQSALESPTTKDALPMCIITGMHMILSDWCFCPNTKFPAIYSAYLKYIEYEEAHSEDDTEGRVARDPILGRVVSAKDLVLSSEEEAKAYLKKYNNVNEGKKTEAADATTNGVASNGAGPNNTEPVNTAASNNPGNSTNGSAAVSGNGSSKGNASKDEKPKKVSFF